MHKNAVLLLFAILVVMPISLVLDVQVTELPSLFLVVVIILGLVAVFGAMVSLLLRSRERKRGR